jgi:glyoxylase-like metal-dependent hydrolase (beta-lactamase superfamily II)/rhodanese-related sulfurtransferase
MVIHQFYDTGLAHGSYAVIREGKMVVIDPSRDPQPYYDFATLHEADIVGVIETHPHADFVSSHLEIHQSTGAIIYVSALTGADYPHETFDDGDVIALEDIQLKAINTPGHSPDSISILVIDELGRQTAIFTGDTLFVGDVGRPDLRENVGNVTAKKEELARQMYHSTRQKLMTLPGNVTVYPAHGPGSLCGKSISPELESTIGKEISENYALMPMDESKFVKLITEDQPFIPKYFGYDVGLNKKGAEGFQQALAKIPLITAAFTPEKDILVVDARPSAVFQKGHHPGAINLQDGDKFETWLGSIVNPGEQFYLLAEDEAALRRLIRKTAKIGYERQLIAAVTNLADLSVASDLIDLADFKQQPDRYTIVDVRNQGEVKEGKVFENALSIPLPELRERLLEIPATKPIVVHCAAGYRSAAASSIVAGKIQEVLVYDLSFHIQEFLPAS